MVTLFLAGKTFHLWCFTIGLLIKLSELPVSINGSTACPFTIAFDTQHGEVATTFPSTSCWNWFIYLCGRLAYLNVMSLLFTVVAGGIPGRTSVSWMPLKPTKETLSNSGSFRGGWRGRGIWFLRWIFLFPRLKRLSWSFSCSHGHRIYEENRWTVGLGLFLGHIESKDLVESCLKVQNHIFLQTLSYSCRLQSMSKYLSGPIMSILLDRHPGSYNLCVTISEVVCIGLSSHQPPAWVWREGVLQVSRSSASCRTPGARRWERRMFIDHRWDLIYNGVHPVRMKILDDC